MNLKDEILVIKIPKYAITYGNVLPKYYTLKDGKAAVYSRTGKRQNVMPAKYKCNAQFTWKLRGVKKVPTLYDIVNNCYVIANQKEVEMGHQIKAQSTNVNNRIHDGVRKQIFTAIKKSCVKYIKGKTVNPNWYPLRIDIVLHDTVGNIFDKKDVLKQRWDIDNKCSVYQKAILDLLHEEKVIEDDDRFYVSAPLCYWKPLHVEDTNERYIQIIIRPDLSARNHILFKQFHNRVPLKTTGAQGKLF